MFKKLFTLFAALTLCVGLWAETVNYLYPVYNTDGDVHSGIKEWKTGSVDAGEITDEDSYTVPLGLPDITTWYVVKGTDVQLSRGAYCAGAVNLILADGAKLTATGESFDIQAPGIQVSNGNGSLTIYAQSTGEAMGQLIANGEDMAAGIGGGKGEEGSNITINGGKVIATGGNSAAGIGGGYEFGRGSNITINGGTVIATGGIYGAGIGGGQYGDGSNITINGGTVIANGGDGAVGIGGGINGYSEKIFVATSLVVKADGNNPPTTVIAATRTATTDIANYLADNRYATVEPKPVPHKGDQFLDEDSSLKFEVTAVGDTNTVKVIKNNYSGTSYTVPDTVKYLDVDFAVTEIGKEAFNYCSSLESITLPEGLLTIGKNAFDDCSSLESVTIPASVTTIGVGAFYECTSLESITLPAGLTTIENEVFNNCEKLQSIIIPADVTTIGEIAFAGSGLQTITIPAGVISLGMGAFAECAGLTSVTFLGNACQNAIGEIAFYEVGEDAPALLTLPNSWTGTLPDEDGKWYGGVFNLREVPTALPNVDSKFKIQNSKLIKNGQLIIDANGKRYNAVGF